MLAIIYIKENIASTVFDHLNAFAKYSSYDVKYIDILREEINLEILNSFDAIILHYTISVFNDDRLPAALRCLLRETTAKKIVFIQDEYRRVNDVVENLRLLGIDCLFTCVPKNEIQKVYPKEKLPNLIVKNTLTGYVSEAMVSDINIPKFHKRQLDVVYRARKLSAWYGQLCYDKWKIADRFSEDAHKHELAVDISSYESDRIYGQDWLEFLKRSKAALGVESGAGVFDFTGEIQRQVEAHEIENPDDSFENIKEKFFKNEDGKIKLNQISPRCFEYAACKTLMILYEGDYSGILKPWKHYVPLKKDHSNMDDVVYYIRNEEKWKSITEQAYNDIILNPNYSYKNFIKEFDLTIKNELGIEVKNTGLLARDKNTIEPSNFKAQAKNPIFRTLCFKAISILPRSMGISLEGFLRKLKRSLSKRHKTLLYGIKKKNFYFVLMSVRQSFCDELIDILELKSYLRNIQEKLNRDVLTKAVEDDTLKLSICFALEKNEADLVFNKVKKILVNVPHSFLIPQEVRGKKWYVKYPKIIFSCFLEN